MQADLRKVGIDMQIQLWDATVAWGKLATQEFDAFVMTYPYVHGDRGAEPLLPSTPGPDAEPHELEGHEDRRAARRGASTATEPAKRAEANAAVQRQLTEANVWIPLDRRADVGGLGRPRRGRPAARHLRLPASTRASASRSKR